MSNKQQEIDNLKSQIENLQYLINNFNNHDHISEDDAIEQIAQCYGDINIMGQTYNEFLVLQKLDSIAFDMYVDDYISNMKLEQFSDYVEMTNKLSELVSQLYDLENE